MAQSNPPTGAAPGRSSPDPANELRSQPHESPTPSEPQQEPPHRATPNKDTDIEHIPPNPNGSNPHPHRGTPPQVNSVADEATPTQRKLHTQPRSKNPRCTTPHSAPQRQGKGPAQSHPRPLAQQGRPHPVPHPQPDPRTMTGQTHPPRGPRPAAGTQGQ
ncbi:hypothetical protein CHARACLAT_027493 [Characodon lateralis]|uniref:Uncharacterized protein n=1 Tax=Characodon lateralis TaxID=208331 RepID=A0ABU7E5I1_9TELE|nr:hypothetical protein [Characodon lateralis]